MLNPGNLPLHAWRNADLRIPLTFENPETGEAMDLTGYNLHAQVRLYAGAGGLALVDMPMTAGPGEPAILSSDLSAGLIELFIPKATLLGLPACDAMSPAKPARLAWDLTWQTPDGETNVLLEGSFTVSTGVTR